MAELLDWIKDSEKYEFCRSYGITGVEGMPFVERQEDFYINLLSALHRCLDIYYDRKGLNSKLKSAMLHIAKGLLVYSQKETASSFHGVGWQKNQLYVSSIYYLCDYAAISAWVLGDILIDEYEETSAQLLAYILTGGRAVDYYEIRRDFHDVFKKLEDFVISGDEELLLQVTGEYNKKYDEQNFESPTDFYMTSVLRCVLMKFCDSNLWKSLRRIDGDFEWKNYAQHSYIQHILSFLPSQQDAIDKGLIGFEGSFSLKMPTSAGKSYITELLIYHELKSNPRGRILYLAPLRALSRELRDRFRKIHQTLGFTYATKYGGSTSSVVEDTINDAQLLIATPESFMSIESFDRETLNSFTLVICDEGQLLDDFSRGVNYEMLLSRLRTYDHVRFLFISAIIPNIEVVNRWLKGSDNHIGNSTYRPSKIVLAEALADDEKADLYVYSKNNNDVSYVISPFITKAEAQDENLRNYHQKEDKWTIGSKAMGCTLALRSLSAGSVLLFTTSKTRGVSCTGLTKHMIQMVSKDCFDYPIKYVRNNHDLNDLVEYAVYMLGTDHLLCQALNHGFAFHHGDVPQELREKIERAYDKGVIRLIISNTTLAEGVNLPIKTIIIAHAMDQSRPGLYLPKSRLKNIIGRVGRAGRERYGTVIVPVIKRNDYLVRQIKDALNSDDSKLEAMRGTLYDLIDFLVRKKVVDNENDVNQLLSTATFLDAIDEMIIRSSDNGLDNVDIELMVTNSLAYSLSDDRMQEAIKKVFEARYHVLREHSENEKYQLLKVTGLNLRELEFVAEFMTQDKVAIATNTNGVASHEMVSMMINCVMSLPTVVDSLKYDTQTKQRLFADIERIKIVAALWMNGAQYHEIAREVNVTVDEAILLVMLLQGTVYDKATKIISYLKEVHGIDNNATLHWAECTKIGIYKKVMYNYYQMRIPERIQLHALYRCYREFGYDSIDTSVLRRFLIVEKNKIRNKMCEEGYPKMSIESLMDVVGHIEKEEQ